MDDLTNCEFSRWKVLMRDGDKKGYCICRCKCGTVRSVRERELKSGGSQSCGCLQKERTKLPKNRKDIRHKRRTLYHP